jgi:hypothetical protein
MKTKSKPQLPQNFTYDQELTFIRLGKSYARDWLLANGWTLDKDGFFKDPVKKDMTKDLENAFWMQIVRDTHAKTS